MGKSEYNVLAVTYNCASSLANELSHSSYEYFEPFINLPPRSLRDYYRIITEPLSIRKLQKMVKGIHGRNDAAGVSDFKGWGAFEEKSSLLWKNAYYYNEEGSDIHELAKELEVRMRAPD